MITTGRSCCNKYEIKAIHVESPTASDNIGFLYSFNATLTIQKIVAVLPSGTATPSMTYSFRFNSNRSSSGTEVVVGGSTVTSTSIGDAVTVFTNQVIPANNFLWLTTTALSGNVPKLEVYVFYKTSY